MFEMTASLYRQPRAQGLDRVRKRLPGRDRRCKADALGSAHRETEVPSKPVHHAGEDFLVGPEGRLTERLFEVLADCNDLIVR
jgi:hypothetical protein